MLTIAEIRRARLEILIAQFGGVIADLNDALGYERTAPQLTRIRNANVRIERGKPYQMGDTQAREIERLLGLDRGWMDAPPGYEALSDPKVQELNRVARELQPYQITHLVKVAKRLQSDPLADGALPAPSPNSTTTDERGDAAHAARGQLGHRKAAKVQKKRA